MKKFHFVKENYPVIFKYTKPDEYSDGSLEKHAWYFSVCDWMGNEIDGFDNENEMLNYWETMSDDESEDAQFFVYPTVDDELERYQPFPLDSRLYNSPERETYVFNL